MYHCKYFDLGNGRTIKVEGNRELVEAHVPDEDDALPALNQQEPEPLEVPTMNFLTPSDPAYGPGVDEEPGAALRVPSMHFGKPAVVVSNDEGQALEVPSMNFARDDAS